MEIDSDEILRSIRETKREDKQRFSIYVSKKTYEKFKKSCGEISYSAVLEKLMELFSEVAG